MLEFRIKVEKMTTTRKVSKIEGLIKYFDGLSGDQLVQAVQVEVTNSDDDDSDSENVVASSYDSEEEDLKAFQDKVDFPITPDGIKERITFLNYYDQKTRGEYLICL